MAEKQWAAEEKIEKVAGEVNLFTCQRAANIEHCRNCHGSSFVLLRKTSLCLLSSTPHPPRLHTQTRAHTHKSVATQHYDSFQWFFKPRMGEFLLTHRAGSLCKRNSSGHSEAAALNLESRVLLCVHKRSKTSKQPSARRFFTIRYSL